MCVYTYNMLVVISVYYLRDIIVLTNTYVKVSVGNHSNNNMTV